MLKKLFRPGTRFPTNREEGVAYAGELAVGIKLWIKIDCVVVPLAILLWVIGVVPVVLLGLVVFFALGCPIIMVFGYFIGCLKYLKVGECKAIIVGSLRREL